MSCGRNMGILCHSLITCGGVTLLLKTCTFLAKVEGGRISSSTGRLMPRDAKVDPAVITRGSELNMQTLALHTCPAHVPTSLILGVEYQYDFPVFEV